MEHICDAGELLETALAGKSIMFEAQLGALRDIDYGIYPFTSSSPAGGLRAGGLRAAVAQGPRGGRDQGVLHLRGRRPVRGRTGWRGGRQAARGGRGIWRRHRPPAPRGVDGYRGHALRHEAAGRDRTGADEDGRFELSGRNTRLRGLRKERRAHGAFPYTPDLDGCKPVYEVLPGWKMDISACREYEQLPAAARDYVEFIERTSAARSSSSPWARSATASSSAEKGERP